MPRRAASAQGATADPGPPPFAVDDVPVTNWREHPFGIIIASHDPPADITFTIRSDFCRFKRYDLPDAMEEVTTAYIRRWVRKDDGALTIHWLADETESSELLAELLMPCFQLTFIRYHNAPRKAVPLAHGSTARREYARAITQGPFAHLFGGVAGGSNTDEATTICVNHNESGRSRQVTWHRRAPQFVQEDWRPGSRERLSIRGGPRGWSVGQYNSLEKMLFHVALPSNLVEFLVDCVNDRLTGDANSGPRKRQTTAGEVVRFFGYMGALTLNQEETLDRMWRVNPADGDIFGPPAMGKHGMTLTRFEALRAALSKPFRLSEEDLDPTDAHRYVRPLVNLFIAAREKQIVPSWLIVLDESMSAWLGAEGVLDGEGANSDPCPHVSFVERKPEPLGSEWKVAADGECGVFLKLEIQEGAEAMQYKEFEEEYNPTVANVLRLCKQWFKTASTPLQPTRAIAGDSWFMGLDTVEALYQESGHVLYGFGDVKTKTSGFPRDDLAAMVGPLSGDWATVTTEVDMGEGDTLHVGGVAHRRGPEVHTYIFTCGTTSLGEPAEHAALLPHPLPRCANMAGKPQKHKDDDLDVDTGYTIARKCPKVLNDYTVAQPKIDRSNKKRQHYLAMEKRFPTHSFPFRALTTILGIIYTDCFYLHQYLNARDQVEWRHACRRMFYAFMHNNLDEIEKGTVDASNLFNAVPTKPSTPKPAEAMKQGSSFERINGHLIVPFSFVPWYPKDKKKKQQWCIECGMKCTSLCILCSTPDAYYPIHHASSTHPDCSIRHTRDPHAKPCTRPRSCSTPNPTSSGEQSKKRTRSTASTSSSQWRRTRSRTEEDSEALDIDDEEREQFANDDEDEQEDDDSESQGEGEEAQDDDA